MRMIFAEGTHNQIGYEQGVQLKREIRYNIASMEENYYYQAIDKKELANHINKFISLSSTSSLELMEGISKGSGISFDSILRFNALQEILSPEGCTSFAATGSATSLGQSILLKNRDHRYYKDNTIGVFQVLKTEDQNVIGIVSNAGEIGVKMGLNKHGVAVCSNTGPVEGSILPQLADNQLGRGTALKEALEYHTAREAVNHVLNKLTNLQLQIPGILFFVDAENIFVIEADKNFAVIHITDGCIVRANRFLVLDNHKTGVEKEISSICRYLRGKQLLEENLGKIDREKMIAFSMDHKNGPVGNSICRHDKNQKESPTVSAGIMEIDKQFPEKSKISFAFGSPCWAWSNEDGNFTFQMDEDSTKIPEQFLDGTAFKKYIKPVPYNV